MFVTVILRLSVVMFSSVSLIEIGGGGSSWLSMMVYTISRICTGRSRKRVWVSIGGVVCLYNLCCFCCCLLEGAP